MTQRMTASRTDGFLLVDKPAGVTSHDVVAQIRRSRDGVRTGHTGTLDPFATGLLIVALGTATRLIRFVPAEPKVYEAVIQFGAATDTDDATGAVVQSAPAPVDAVVRDAIAQLTGTIDQQPPDYSAKQVGGQRAYRLARKGREPGLSPATVTVHGWDVRSFVDGVLHATITCGSGTYIRALARDLGRLSGSVAHLAALRRTHIGPFDVTNAVSPAVAHDTTPLAPAEALVGMLRCVVDDDGVSHLRHGRSIPATAVGDRAALLDATGELVAIAEREGEWWRPRIVLGNG